MELRQELAGLGGDAQFYKVTARAAYYRPMNFNTFFLGLRGRVGQVVGLGEDITQSQRFFLGGRDVRASPTVESVRVIRDRRRLLAVIL